MKGKEIGGSAEFPQVYDRIVNVRVMMDFFRVLCFPTITLRLFTSVTALRRERRRFRVSSGDSATTIVRFSGGSSHMLRIAVCHLSFPIIARISRLWESGPAEWVYDGEGV